MFIVADLVSFIFVPVLVKLHVFMDQYNQTEHSFFLKKKQLKGCTKFSGSFAAKVIHIFTVYYTCILSMTFTACRIRDDIVLFSPYLANAYLK